jgi:hypothetical protein
VSKITLRTRRSKDFLAFREPLNSALLSNRVLRPPLCGPGVCRSYCNSVLLPLADVLFFTDVASLTDSFMRPMDGVEPRTVTEGLNMQTVTCIKMAVLGVVLPCRQVQVYQRDRPDDGGSTDH